MTAKKMQYLPGPGIYGPLLWRADVATAVTTTYYNRIAHTPFSFPQFNIPFICILWYRFLACVAIMVVARCWAAYYLFPYTTLCRSMLPLRTHAKYTYIVQCTQNTRSLVWNIHCENGLYASMDRILISNFVMFTFSFFSRFI